MKRIWLIMTFLVTSCTTSAGNQSNGRQINTPNFSSTLQETHILTQESDTPAPYSTLIPTLETLLARQRVSELFETNNRCNLSCWWGITPGKTTWDDASNILTPVALKIYLDFPRRQKESITVNVIPPAETHYGSYLAQEYTVENDIVTEITLWYNFDLAKFTDFKPFIREYGAPDQIYIHGYGEPQLDAWPFQIALFYPQQGMLFGVFRLTSNSR